MTTVPMVIQVSKYAMDLIKAGKAYPGSGGIRLLNGQFVELYKFTSPLLAQSRAQFIPVSPFVNHANLVSSANPIGIAAQLVNLGFSYQNGQRLNKAIHMLASLQTVAWAGTAIGAANLALNVVGFAIVNSKLDGLSKQLSSAVDELKKEMKAIQLEDKTVEILTLIDNLKSAANILAVNSLNKQNELQLEHYLNSATQLIVWLKDQFEKVDPAMSGTLFTLLFDLTSMYSSVVKEYSAQYFYLEDRFPGNFSGWMEVFGYADSKPLQSGLKRTIWLANPVDTTEKLESAYDFTLNTVRLQQQELKETQQIVPQMPREVYLDFDNYVKQKIEAGEVEVVEKAQEEDPRERVLLQKNGFAAA